MDEGVDEEVIAIDPESAHLQRKESECLPKPESSNVLDSRENDIPADTGYPSSSHEVFANILDGKNLSRNVSAFAGSDDHSMDGGGIMVEELTVRNYNSATLASNREKMKTTRNQWQRLYQSGPGSGSGSSCGDVVCGGQEASTVWEDMDHKCFPKSLPPKMSCHNYEVAVEKLENNENKAVSGDTFPSGGIRTKILSKSGFSEFFIKSSLRGKGLICRGPVHAGYSAQLAEQNDPKATNVATMASASSQNSGAKAALNSVNVDAGFGLGPESSNEGVSLREWLKAGHHKVNKFVNLNMFKQIVDLVNFSHSQGLALQDLRPSCFMLLPSNKVKYLGKCFNHEVPESVSGQNLPLTDNCLRGKRLKEQNMYPHASLCTKKQKSSYNASVIRWLPPYSSTTGSKLESATLFTDSRPTQQSFGHQISCKLSSDQECKPQNKSSSPHMSCTAEVQLITVTDQLEEKWYTSPEELSKRICTLSSNIYHLGVLLFELHCSFNSEQSHVAAMSDLRHRILPPQFLSECPREAGFCLWLLHPEPSSRPTTRAILQSEVIAGLQEVCGDELSTLEDDDIESELLSHFLLSLKEQKHKRASKLVEDIRCLEGDIEEVEERRLLKTPLVLSCSQRDCHNGGESRLLCNGTQSPEALQILSSLSGTNDMRLIKNMSQLESAYFSMRSKIQVPESENTMHSYGDLLKNQGHGSRREKSTDPLGTFFDGLCKYARYSKFEVRSVLRNGDFINSANVICSLSFDRDEDYFAAAGISKKIKIFDFHALISDSVGIHYPVVEMVNRSKLSCVSWNNYIKNYLASADYDGIVKLWDAGTGQAFSQYIEHQKRAWSVDFSRVDPTRLASGSDDHTVKLWSINEKNCLGTIRNKANVCCVQFSAHSPHLMAFGSADYKTFCYDLRNAKTPWCVFAGHEKAVSYVKFLDSTAVVSASTDNTLKLWDLNKISSSGLYTDACYLTFSGHTNEKNFVGLSVDDGYIACGSETNEVYAYYKSMPMPITSHKFGSIDSISGKETDDDGGQFVSSVCWRRKSDMVVAANSTGSIKVLQMV